MDEQQELTSRIRKQIEMEIAGDVDGLYGLIDPKIREKRETERDDEPSLTMNGIRSFTSKIRSAEVTEIHFSKWEVAHDGTPAAVAEVAIIYNSQSEPSKSRTVWYQRDGNWYTTSLGKRWFPKSND
jgi:hypothetical protein